MNNQLLLIGSLSNDLLRVANSIERGSVRSAQNFWNQGQLWLKDLLQYQNKPYIQKLLLDLKNDNFSPTDKIKAEKYLMQSILLQNATLHFKKIDSDY